VKNVKLHDALTAHRKRRLRALRRRLASGSTLRLTPWLRPLEAGIAKVYRREQMKALYRRKRDEQHS
jgi:hypothetical protein